MHGQKIGGQIKEVSPSAPEVVAYISTGDEDRTGERLDPKGWLLDSFKKTGVVSFSHGGWGTPVAGLPIGKAIDLWTDDKGLLAHTRFAVDQPDPVGSWAKLIYSMLKEDIIRGWSVWFDPLEWIEADGTEVKRKRGAGWFGPNPGRLYKAQELIEYGPVFIPANAEAATVVAKSLEGLQERGIWTPPSFVQERGFAEVTHALTQDESDGSLIVAPDATKEGRVLSTANVARVKRAITATTDCTAALKELLSAAGDGGDEDEDEDDDEKCLPRVDGDALGLRLAGALSGIRRDMERWRRTARSG